MSRDEGPLLRVAGAVAEGTPVDWGAELRKQPELQEKLQILEALETLSLTTAAPPGQAPTTVPGARGPSSRSSQETQVPDDWFSGADLPATWGHLQIRERIGEGAFGEVYRAHDPQLQMDVALKLQRTELGCDGAAAERFLDEARRLARVHHPGVVVVHGADCHGNRLGLWTELLEGETLEEFLGDHGTLGAEEAALVGLHLCRALAAVHAAGLVHRDVKPANVMREHGGRIVLLDFSSVSEQPGATPAGEVRGGGTPLFMAPEILAGQEPTAAADLYSLGVLLYRMVSGTFPVEAKTLAELREKLRDGKPRPLRDRRPDLPAGFIQVVDRALAPVADRFRTAGEMERALGIELGQGKPDPVERPKRRAAWSLPLGLAAAMILAVLAGWVFLPLSVPLEVDVTLFRVRSGLEEQLLPGARVAPGDDLALELRTNRAAHVIVLNEDRQGRAFVLFPLPGLDLQNPVPGRFPLRLPGTVDGQPKYWGVDSAGGGETILVIASTAPLAEVMEAIASLPRSGGAPPELTDETRIALRGIGTLSDPGEPAPGGKRAQVVSLAEQLGQQASADADLWTWTIQLQNEEVHP